MLPSDLPTALEKLVNLGQTPDVNIRPVLLRVLVDLFVSKLNHGSDAIRQFDEIVPRLLDEADETARLIVAKKLAGHPQTSENLLKRLLAERGAVAEAVLSRAGLDASMLQAAASLGTPQMAAAVARRPDLDATTTRALAERPEPEIVRALAENVAAPLDQTLHRYLVRRAREHEAVATALLNRDGDPADLAALFLLADRKQRAAILTALRRQDLGLPRAEPAAGSDLVLAQIARIVLLPGMDGLDLVLCQALGLPAPLAERIIDDPGGEPMAVALAALGAKPDLAARLFILGPAAIGHVYGTVKSLVGIVDTLSPGAARRLMASIAGEAPVARRPARPETAAERANPVLRPERRDAAQQNADIRKAG